MQNKAEKERVFKLKPCISLVWAPLFISSPQILPPLIYSLHFSSQYYEPFYSTTSHTHKHTYILKLT